MSTRITDHAVMRWMERIECVDVESIRERLHQRLAPLVRLVETAPQLSGITRYAIHGPDATFIVDGGGAIVTVLEPQTMPRLALWPGEVAP